MEQQIKSGDTVELIKEVYGLTIGKGYNVVDVSEDGRIIHIKDDDGDYRKRHKTEFKLKSSNMELKITKDKVLQEAAKCSTAKATLETLFPEAFEGDDPLSHISHLGKDGWIDAILSNKWQGKANIGVDVYNGKTCFFLSANYKWEIAEDNYLIPTRKTS